MHLLPCLSLRESNLRLLAALCAALYLSSLRFIHMPLGHHDLGSVAGVEEVDESRSCFRVL